MALKGPMPVFPSTTSSYSSYPAYPHDQLAAVVPIDDDILDRIDALTTPRARLAPASAIARHAHDRRARAAARLKLRAADGRMNGATYRDIAIAIYGAARIDIDPWKTSPLRDAVSPSPKPDWPSSMAAICTCFGIVSPSLRQQQGWGISQPKSPIHPAGGSPPPLSLSAADRQRPPTAHGGHPYDPIPPRSATLPADQGSR